jgi:hypothetical protein
MSTPYYYRMRVGQNEYEIGFAHLHELVDYLSRAGPFAPPAPPREPDKPRVAPETAPEQYSA